MTKAIFGARTDQSSLAGNKRLWVIFFLLSLAIGLILRIYLVSTAKTPGTSDTAFYYTVAKSIAEGRGLVIDYVIYYFNGLIPITHYSNDYWLPLASILLSLPMLVFGKTVTSALIASVLAGLVPSLVGFFAARQFSNSYAFAAFVGALTFFAPLQITASVTTDTVIFFGAFGSLALYLSVLGRQNSRYFLIAAVCTGLAHLTRQDGLLLLATVLAFLLLTEKTLKEKLLLATGMVSLHLVVLAPLLIRNFVEMHSIFSAGLSKTLFLTKYEDMYSYGKDLSWQAYRAQWGIRKIIAYRFYIAGYNLSQFASFLSPVLTALVVIGLIDLIRLKKWTEMGFLAPALIFVGLGYMFYSFIWSVHGPGSFYKSLLALMPFLCIIIVDLLTRYIHDVKTQTLLIVALAIFGGYQGYQQAYQFNSFYNAAYENYNTAKTLIFEDASRRNIDTRSVVLMTRSPWDVNAATGLRAVMVPNNDLDTIIFVARHYNAHYILLPAQRARLDDIYSGIRNDPRLQYISDVPNSDMKIFWIDFNQ